MSLFCGAVRSRVVQLVVGEKVEASNLFCSAR